MKQEQKEFIISRALKNAISGIDRLTDDTPNVEYAISLFEDTLKLLKAVNKELHNKE